MLKKSLIVLGTAALAVTTVPTAGAQETASAQDPTRATPQNPFNLSAHIDFETQILQPLLPVMLSSLAIADLPRAILDPNACTIFNVDSGACADHYS
ncbi:hypothetical protein [Corynebacterium sp.]|uniref:hypothetical protein n=1 Tax=Corynebacterium sp. TaxID=1720 RepID=UPI0026DC5EA6|nr:hypothetical protein [Corynebacterium sp.]MDO5032889.1 hypothetical protein [Corynebacterium sp.]